MTDASSFTGRTALVTGAASGIGAATAKWLDNHGIAKLILIDRDADKLQALELSCETDRCIADVSDPEFWSGLEAAAPKIDHALINAGIAIGGPIAQQPFEEWRRLMSVNLDGAFLTLGVVLRSMLKHGGGSIVMTSSVTAVKALPGGGGYAVTKAGVAHLAKIAAVENADKNIRVNAIAPGGVVTAIYESDPNFVKLMEEKGRDAAFAEAASTTPIGRFASAEEIADTIGYLLSDRAANITGIVMSSDGGLSL
jgi:NAD(P)-dependent dehydrogenase (short-subunit alcohol dehydrogenase family)